MGKQLINITANELDNSIRLFWNLNGQAIVRTSMGAKRTTVWLANGSKSSFSNTTGTTLYTTINDPKIVRVL